MVIQKVCSGMVMSNSYFVGDGEKGVLIDVGADADDIFKMVDKAKMEPKMILLTHCHFDHIESLNIVREAYHIPVGIHREDAAGLINPRQNGSILIGVQMIFDEAEVMLFDGQEIEVGSITYQVIHTPGHTMGGICFLAEDCLFCGDTIFKLSVGRTDLGDGDHRLLIQSIKDRILSLGNHIKLYPGHGPFTTVKDERSANPFIQ